MASDRLILGTRGSALALAQAELTEAALRHAHPDLRVERRVFTTTGDRRLDLSLAAPGIDKGVFTKELETALAGGEIDIAVHSLKDVPTELEDGFAITAVLPRARIEDVLIARGTENFTIGSLPDSATVATSSVRRARQLQWIRPDLKVVEIRGNVPTRLRKTAFPASPDGPDFTLLALAGLDRLGIWDGQSRDPLQIPGDDDDPAPLSPTLLDPSTFLPAACQGAVGLETRVGDTETTDRLQAINHPDTWTRITAERHFLHRLQGGCQTPVGVFSEFQGTHQLRLKTRVFPDEPGSPPKSSRATGPANDPKALANQAFESLSR